MIDKHDLIKRVIDDHIILLEGSKNEGLDTVRAISEEILVLCDIFEELQ